MKVFLELIGIFLNELFRILGFGILEFWDFGKLRGNESPMKTEENIDDRSMFRIDVR